ncbi:MAG: hypothetical protein K0Q73_5371 [Paenibacillus sp.]|nr:hypothetical protein [Paenibacillus sp.]
MDMLTFGQAMDALKEGKKVARAGWNGWIKLITPEKCQIDLGPDSHLEVLPFIGLKTADDKLTTWFPSKINILAEDWIIVEEKKCKCGTSCSP